MIILAVIIRVVWLAIEVPYVQRSRIRTARDLDRHSAKIWDGAGVIEAIGIVLAFAGVGRIHSYPAVIPVIGLILLGLGITTRWAAILTLGKYFSGKVTIASEHRLIKSGLYRHLRHPAYTGALLAHFGLSLCLSNLISLVLIVVPFSVAALYRIHVEEEVLRNAFGKEYVDYARRTRRLVPGLY
jgi:protein-S-isoprenylcysteine O-methyltransferase Ste14